MRRFLFSHEVKAASGSQTFYVDAETLEEARAILKTDGGEIYSNEVEVTDLSEPEDAGETTLDDFGDFEPASLPPEHAARRPELEVPPSQSSVLMKLIRAAWKGDRAIAEAYGSLLADRLDADGGTGKYVRSMLEALRGEREEVLIHSASGASEQAAQVQEPLSGQVVEELAGTCRANTCRANALGAVWPHAFAVVVQRACAEKWGVQLTKEGGNV